jgi:hypothetical protein
MFKILEAKIIVSKALDDGDLATASKELDRRDRQKIQQEKVNIEMTHEQWLGTLE